MKIKVIAHYCLDDGDPNFPDDIRWVELETLETGLDTDAFYNLVDVGTIEDELHVTIDTGGDDVYEELDLPDYCDNLEEATALAQRVLDRVNEILTEE